MGKVSLLGTASMMLSEKACELMRGLLPSRMKELKKERWLEDATSASAGKVSPARQVLLFISALMRAGVGH